MVKQEEAEDEVGGEEGGAEGEEGGGEGRWRVGTGEQQAQLRHMEAHANQACRQRQLSHNMQSRHHVIDHVTVM